METDIRYSEPSSPACERETAANAEQWASWTTNQIRSAVEAERQRTFDLLAELLARIQSGPPLNLRGLFEQFQDEVG